MSSPVQQRSPIGNAVRAFLAMLTLLGPGGGARADEPPALTLSGFGTLGAVYNDNRDGTGFRRDVIVSSGAPARRWSFGQDSKLGVQADLRHDDTLGATLQVISRNRYDTGYTPELTWAFVKWMPRPDLTLRAGRLGVEFYILGDTTEIGYANLGLPTTQYPISADGVDAEWMTPMGAGTLRLKGQLTRLRGKMRMYAEQPGDADGTRVADLHLEYAQGPWLGRVTAGRLTVHVGPLDPSVQALYDALASPAVPRGAEIRDLLTLEGRVQSYVGAGLGYDSGSLRFLGYAGTLSSPGWADVHLLKAQAGYRIGEFTPYAGYLRQWTGRGLIETGIPMGFSAATDTLNQAALAAQAAVKANQTIATLGLRYELSRNTALKFQVDSVRYQDSPNVVDPSLLTTDVAGRGFKSMTIYSTALEFVF